MNDRETQRETQDETQDRQDSPAVPTPEELRDEALRREEERLSTLQPLSAAERDAVHAALGPERLENLKQLLGDTRDKRSEAAILGDEYIVQSGDTLYAIARGLLASGRFPQADLGSLVARLEELPGVAADALHPGQRIFVAELFREPPTDMKDPEAQRGVFPATQYSIQKGDNLFRVLLNYRDSLPDGEKYAQLRGTPIKDFIMVAMKQHGIDPLALRVGTVIDFERVVSTSSVAETKALLQREEGSGTDIQVPEAKRKRASKSSDFVAKSEMISLSLQAADILREEGHSISPVLLMGLASVESSFDRLVISSAKAYGVAQVKEATGGEVWSSLDSQTRTTLLQRLSADVRKEYSSTGKAGEFHRSLLHDPLTCLVLGGKYLAKNINDFGGNVAYALEAYNRGPTGWKAMLASNGPAQALGKVSYHRKVLDRTKGFEDLFSR